jgi:hypothetical protein
LFLESKFPKEMLKIPSFILGGILILTGLISYLVQDPSLSIKLTGPWASDAEFVLSDGDQEVMLDFMPCDGSAGENVWWIVHKLNERHARETNEKNNARKGGRLDGDLQSFWYASSTGETLGGLLQESENYSNAGTENYESIEWPEIDVEQAKLRFIYNNLGGADGPVTLTSTNWENVLNAPENGESLEFGKSWTAFIPGIIGLLLILLAIAADKAPNAKKHIMHVAVLIALLGFLSIAKMVFGAFAEMSWWRGEPYLIYDASSLKPTSMLLSAGLLLIYVILCVVSFITARKEMAAQAARDAAKKAAVLKKASKRESIDDESKPKDKKPSDSKESPVDTESKKVKTPTKKDTDSTVTPSADTKAPAGTPKEGNQSPKAPSSSKPAKPSARPTSPAEEKKEQPPAPSAEKPQPAEKSDEQTKTPSESKEGSDKPEGAPGKSSEKS